MGRMISGTGAAPLVVALLSGCSQLEDGAPLPAAGGGSGTATAEMSAAGTGGTDIDARPAVQAPTPPVSGSNLLIDRTGTYAVVADSDRDRVVMVAIGPRQVVAELALAPGDEPGRLVEDAGRRVHVALRGGAAVVTVSLDALNVVERRPVCRGPRGIAFDAASDSVVVACVDGRLVALPSSGGPITRSTYIGPDLRDVVINSHGTWISTFKSARLRRVSADGLVSAELELQPRKVLSAQRDSGGAPRDLTFAPGVAWRALSTPDGDRLVMLHQFAQVDAVKLPDENRPVKQAPYEGDGGDAGNACRGVVRTAVSFVTEQGQVTTSPTLSGGTLAVDADISPDGARLAVAFAGQAELSATLRGASMISYTVMSTEMLDQPASDPGSRESPPPSPCTSGFGMDLADPATAVRFNPQNPKQLFILTRRNLYVADDVSAAAYPTRSRWVAPRSSTRVTSCFIAMWGAASPALRAIQRAPRMDMCGLSMVAASAALSLSTPISPIRRPTIGKGSSTVSRS